MSESGMIQLEMNWLSFHLPEIKALFDSLTKDQQNQIRRYFDKRTDGFDSVQYVSLAGGLFTLGEALSEEDFDGIELNLCLQGITKSSRRTVVINSFYETGLAKDPNAVESDSDTLTEPIEIEI